jgi:hypothetical protein
MVIILSELGMFNLNQQEGSFPLVPQTWLTNLVIDQRTKICLHHNASQQEKIRNNDEVKTWTIKIKRKKAISLQQNLAVIMS